MNWPTGWGARPDVTKPCRGCGHRILHVYEWCAACGTKPEDERPLFEPPALILGGDGRPIQGAA